ncbi:MAG: peptidase M16 [Cellvibrio sp. 79]|nr:MAG: peptidase M16 [Cellvibrio sp. 79]
MAKMCSKQSGARSSAIYAVCICLLALPLACVALEPKNVGQQETFTLKKGESDKREYRYLVLENQLRVLLISDPATEKSAAALDVNVGANQNPRDREGLAHFLEHMLFLGTEKYPHAGEYQEFISQHGGSYNAYTAAENTNYFFDIDNNQLEPALDRFSQFFVAPLFSPEYVERERKAVHSEFLAKLKDDGRREWEIYRELMNPNHPGAKFSVGNLTTLADRDGHSVRDDMLAFYEQHYSSHLMNLVVLGREPLNVLEEMVQSRFNKVPHREIKISTQYPTFFSPGTLPASLDIKPEKELRSLSFSFPIPNPDNFYLTKPYGYIAHLLGHEGSGSLLSLLKRLGWADAVYANTALENRSDALFQLSIQLTPQGVRARDQIVSLVFHCIEQLRERGAASWRYSELQIMSDLNFRFQEKRAPMETVSELAQSMSIFKPQDILSGNLLYANYDEKLIQKSLSYLADDNVLIALTAPEVDVYRVSQLYSAPYSLRAGISELMELKPAVRQELSLPDKNLFIPKRLTVKTGSMLEQQGDVINRKPELIVNNKNTRVWYAQDREFIQPRATINLRVKSPLASTSALGAAREQLFVALINDQLNEFVYPARLAGIDLAVEANARGFDIKIFGYSARQGLLINKVMESIKAGKFNEDRYSLLKENLLRNLRNQNKDLPYQVLAKQIPVLQTSPSWSNAQLIAALESTTFEQFNQFVGRHLIDARLDAFFYGNYFRAEALKLAVLAEHELLNKQAVRELPEQKLLMLPQTSDKPWLYVHNLEHPDNIIELLIQSPSASIDDNAHMLLVRQLLQPAFYHQLRTQKQLGYIVAAIPAQLLTLENTLLVVQSPVASEAEIINEIDRFLADKVTGIANPEEFSINQQSLINELREPARSLKEQGDRYWNAITVYEEQFSRRLDLADAVVRITPESLAKYYRAVFTDKNRRLWLSSQKLTERENFFLIDNLLSYKQQLQSPPAP